MPGTPCVGPKLGSMQGLHCWASIRIVSSSCIPHEAQLSTPLKQVLQADSDGSRQSLWPAKFSRFTRLIQSQTVVIASVLSSHVPLAHTVHPNVPPEDCAKQVASSS